MPYGAFAQTKVLALEVSKADLLSKFPKDFLLSMEYIAIERKKWLLQRVRSIKKTSKQVYKKDPRFSVYKESFKNLVRQHPRASNFVLQNFRNKQVSECNEDNNLSISVYTIPKRMNCSEVDPHAINENHASVLQSHTHKQSLVQSQDEENVKSSAHLSLKSSYVQAEEPPRARNGLDRPTTTLNIRVDFSAGCVIPFTTPQNKRTLPAGSEEVTAASPAVSNEGEPTWAVPSTHPSQLHSPLAPTIAWQGAFSGSRGNSRPNTSGAVSRAGRSSQLRTGSASSQHRSPSSEW